MRKVEVEVSDQGGVGDIPPAQGGILKDVFFTRKEDNARNKGMCAQEEGELVY